MSIEANELPPLVHVVTPEMPVLAADWTHAAEARLIVPTSEQVRAADRVFAARKHEQTTADVLGLWSSALILHDLAGEAFQVPEEKDERKKKATDGD